MEPEPFHVVIGVAKRANFQFATIARAGINLNYVKRATKEFARALADLPRNDCDLGLRILTYRLRNCGGFPDLSEE